jgi:hypothetical protein
MVETISVREESSSSFLATRVSLIGSGQRAALSLAALSLFLASFASLAGGAAEVASCRLITANRPPKRNILTSNGRNMVRPLLFVIPQRKQGSDPPLRALRDGKIPLRDHAILFSRTINRSSWFPRRK